MSVYYQFKCLNCGHTRAEEILTDAEVAWSFSQAETEPDPGTFAQIEFAKVTVNNGTIDHYQCEKCGVVLRKENSQPVSSNEEMGDWLRLHGIHVNAKGEPYGDPNK